MGEFIKTFLLIVFIVVVGVAIYFATEFSKFSSGVVDFDQPIDMTLNSEYVFLATFDWQTYDIGDIHLRYPKGWETRIDEINPKALTLINNTEDVPSEIFIEPILAGTCGDKAIDFQTLYGPTAAILKDTTYTINGAQGKLGYAYIVKPPQFTKHLYACVSRAFSGYAITLTEQGTDIRIRNLKTFVTLLNAISSQ